jgi:glycosyltransferase involved in cell wall biosynthesis
MVEKKEFISVVIPCYQEKNHIESCLQSVVDQTYGQENYEVIVVDGMSTDGTREIIQSYVEKYPNVTWLDNEQHITPVAMNLGIKAAKGDYVIRLDAHSSVPSNYIERCWDVMQTTGSDVVGGAIETQGKGFWGKLIAYVLTSVFGVGTSFRTLTNYSGYVDTLAFGLYKKKDLLDVGLHDEGLKRGQDWDLNHKIRKRGGKIFLDSSIRPVYYCAESPIKFLKKSFRDGYWIASIFEKRSFRHLVPFFFVMSIIGLAGACYWRRHNAGPLSWVFFPLWGYLSIYLLVAFFYSLGMVRKSGWIALIFGPLLYASFHISRGLGTLYGLLTGVWLHAER